MIQRIQTILLFLFILTLTSTFFFPVWQKIEMKDTESVDIIVTGYVSSALLDDGNKGIVYDYFYISGILILCCLLAIYSIFSYKNRLTQIKIGTTNSMLTSSVVFFFYIRFFIMMCIKISMIKSVFLFHFI